MKDIGDQTSNGGAATDLGAAAFAFDLDGTVYLGDRLLPGAAELLAYLTERRVPHLFATNNSSATVAAYQRRLAGLGITAHRDQIVTSNDVARDRLRAEGTSRAYLVATPAVVAEYAEYGVVHDEADPEAVLLTYDTTLDYAKLRAAARWLLSGLPYLATNPDLVCPTPTGPVPDCGSFIALLASATGRTPEVLGKPHADMAKAIASRLGRRAGEVAFVGDRLYTDVRMANEHGFMAVLTLTGEASLVDLAAGPYRADLVVRDLAELRGRLAERAAAAPSVRA